MPSFGRQTSAETREGGGARSVPRPARRTHSWRTGQRPSQPSAWGAETGKSSHPGTCVRFLRRIPIDWVRGASGCAARPPEAIHRCPLPLGGHRVRPWPVGITELEICASGAGSPYPDARYAAPGPRSAFPRRGARGLTRGVQVAVHDLENRGDVVADGQRGEGQSGRREGADDSLAHHGIVVEVSEARWRARCSRLMARNLRVWIFQSPQGFPLG